MSVDRERAAIAFEDAITDLRAKSEDYGFHRVMSTIPAIFLCTTPRGILSPVKKCTIADIRLATMMIRRAIEVRERG